MKFKVGDVCITQNSRIPLLNGNQLVIVVAINPVMISFKSDTTPYLVRRIDGQPHASTTDIATGSTLWYKRTDAYCPERMLRRPLDDKLPSSRSKAKTKPRKVLVPV